jgi:bifunctional DNA-binding transcriptional regulator/antitoxin component of YhaV-PrlF toxin-antitoxin module
MATPAGPRTTTADHILAAISLPTTEPPRRISSPLPLIQLSALPRDRSMRYAIARLDPSGRISDQATLTALGWNPGDRLDAAVLEGILLIRRSSIGTAAVCTKGRILIPANARHRARLTPGDVFIAAAPTTGLALIHGLWCLDRMLALHYRAILNPDATP